MEYLRDFNLVTVTVRLLLAFIFGGVIGMDRERKGPPRRDAHAYPRLSGRVDDDDVGLFSSSIRWGWSPIRSAFPRR